MAAFMETASTRMANRLEKTVGRIHRLCADILRNVTDADKYVEEGRVEEAMALIRRNVVLKVLLTKESKRRLHQKKLLDGMILALDVQQTTMDLAETDEAMSMFYGIPTSAPSPPAPSPPAPSPPAPSPPSGQQI